MVGKEAAFTAVLALKSHALNDVIHYVEECASDELIKCGTLLDEVSLRRAQGRVAAYREVLELLKYAPSETRRAASREEV